MIPFPEQPHGVPWPTEEWPEAPLGAGRNVAFRLVGTYWSRRSAQDFDYGHRRFLAPMFGWRLTPRTTAMLAITD